jgi:hypothetical protein
MPASFTKVSGGGTLAEVVVGLPLSLQADNKVTKAIQMSFFIAFTPSVKSLGYSLSRGFHIDMFLSMIIL